MALGAGGFCFPCLNVRAVGGHSQWEERLSSVCDVGGSEKLPPGVKKGHKWPHFHQSHSPFPLAIPATTQEQESCSISEQTKSRLKTDGCMSE